MTPTPHEIAIKHATLLPAPYDYTDALDAISNAIAEALDTISDRHLATALREAETARDSWQRAYHDRGEDLASLQQKLLAEIDALRQARDDAVEACRIAVAEHEAYVAMMHDKGV